MVSERISNTIKNARWTLFFNALLLVVNFFSRNVFITYLGKDYTGLISTVMSYIGFLSLAELGVSAALTQALYKPIYEQNQQKIIDIVSIIAFLFRWIGCIIGGAGIILSFFLPTLLEGEGVSLTQIYATFFTLLITTMMSYLVNYKQILLLAAQKNYVVTKIYNAVLVAKFTVQIVLIYYLNLGFWSWLACELSFTLLYALWLELQIRSHYPWLRSSYTHGKKAIKENRGIIRHARNIFGQSIAGKVLLQSDNIVIQKIMGFSHVTYYVNYTMLIQRITSILIGTLSASASGIGHLVASNDKQKINLVFNQTNALYFWLGAIMAFGFFNCVNPLITLWLPNQMIFSRVTVLLLSFNLFIGIVGRPAEYFLSAYALFHDVWASWVQMFINLGLSIWLTLEYGIVGVVIGTAISTALHTLVWRPYFLCHNGFKIPPTTYWLTIIKFIAMTAIAWITVQYTIEINLFPSPNSWASLIIFTLLTTLAFITISGIIFYLTSSGMRTLTTMALNYIRKKH